MGKLVKYAMYEKNLKEVYRLSMERRESDVSVMESIRKGISYSDVVYNYLMTLDIEAVKVIQAVMYLGRDFKYPEKTDLEIEQEIESLDEGEEIINEKKEVLVCADELIDEKLMILFSEKGCNSKEIEARQISSKAPLNEYLNRAFKILGI